VVDIATDLVFEREVALKELHPDTLPGGVERFMREARITGQLDHQAIVPVHDLGQSPSGQPFYTMKLVVGESLADRLRACQALADRLAFLGAFEKVCEAVAFAHSKRVLHRDIKPDNVMISAFGQTYLVDWGLACSMDEVQEPVPARPSSSGNARLTEVGEVLGTPAYMSPEQARGDLAHVDARSDVWGLGATLYEIVSDRPPFQGDSGVEVVFMHLQGVPMDPLPSTVPGPLASIVQKAMQPDPERRYQTAEALLEDVRAWRRGDMVGAHRYTLREKVRLRKIQERLAAVLLFTACATVVVGVSLASLAFNQRSLIRQTQDLQRRMDDTDEERRAARGAMQMLFFGMADQLKDLPGAARAQDTLLNTGRDYYLKQEARLDENDQVALAAVLERMAMLAYDLGRVEEARDTLTRSQRLLASLPVQGAVRRNQAVVFQQQGRMAADAGDAAGAQSGYGQALASTEILLQDVPHDARLERDKAANLLGLGTASIQAGRLDEAQAQIQSAIDTLQGLATDDAGRRDLASGLVSMGDLVASQGQPSTPWYARAEVVLKGQEESPEALPNRIDLLMRQGSCEAAWRLMAPVLQRDPGNWSRAAAGAETALAAGHLEEAVKAAQTVLASKTPSRDTRFFTAVHLMAAEYLLGRPAQTQLALRELTSLRGGSDWSLHAVRRAVRDPRLRALYDHLEQARLLGPRAPQAMRAAVEGFLKG
jgi:tetratricopeptide (TPR) repeat protein